MGQTGAEWLHPAVLADFAHAPQATAGWKERLQRGAELAVDLVTVCDWAAVDLVTPRYAEVGAVSDEVVSGGRRGSRNSVRDPPGMRPADGRS